MKENIEQDERIISELLQGKKPSEIDEETEEVNNLATLQRNLRLFQWSEDALKVLNKNKRKFRVSFQKISIAAGIALFLGIGSFLIFDKNYFTDVVVAENTLRSENDPIEKVNPQKEAYLNFIEGKANYFAGDYETAIKLYQMALETPNLRSQLTEAIEWHLCVAYLQNNQTKECENMLEKIRKNPNPKYEIKEIDLLKLRFQLWLKK